jgi:NAD-dependent dihydropyrimidine dehydrogenase PreA subunit
VIKIDLDKCTGCGTCVENCPQEILELRTVGTKKKAQPTENWEDMCVACRYCQKFCPYNSITVEIPGYELW